MRWLTCAVCSLTLATHVQAQFRSGVEVVRVDVAVTEGNRPVHGLTAADFELRDNGVAQRVREVTVDQVPVSVLLALDVSGSVDGAPLRALRDAAASAVSALRPAERISLLSFANAVAIACPWTTVVADAQAAIARLAASGRTALYDAAYTALTLRDADPERRTVVLLFTDGEDTVSWLSGQMVADLARRTDAVVYSITTRSTVMQANPFRFQLGTGIRVPAPQLPPERYFDDFLDVLAQETGGRILRVADVQDLRTVFVGILDEFRARYVLSYTPTGVASTGWHTIDVKVKRGTVRARRGYMKE
jgi:Ca-activated chloride channel homolog